MKSTRESLSRGAANFSAQLKRFRLDRQMSEEELGLLLSVSSYHVSRMERGEAMPAEPIWQRFEGLVKAANLYASAVCTDDGEREAVVVPWAEANRAVQVEETPIDRLEGLRSACPDQQAFGIRLAGDSMEPHYRAGQVIVVMPNPVATA